MHRLASRAAFPWWRSRKAAFFLATSLGTPALEAQWSTDPGTNNAVASLADTQSRVVAVSGGSGSIILFWRSRRFDPGTSTFVHDLFAQRISATGVNLWAPGGVRLATGTLSPESARAIAAAPGFSTGLGTAVVVWRDVRNGPDGDIYAQKVNANGIPQWPVGGVPVAIAGGVQRAAVVAADPAAGAAFAWEDHRSGNADIYAQRLTASGLTMWTAGGVAVSAAAQDQLEPVMAGRVAYHIAWTDHRGTDPDVYAQLVDEFGGPQWTLGGVPVGAAPGPQDQPQIAGNTVTAEVVWRDGRTGDPGIYAQRLDAKGVPQWTGNGVPVAVAPNASNPTIGPASSLLFAWSDERNGAGDADVFAQQLDQAGASMWAANGVTVSAAGGDQSSPVLLVGFPNSVIAWEDARNGESDVFMQKLDQAGIPLWNANGAPVSMAAHDQQRLSAIVPSILGVILAWEDSRDPANDLDIYASFVNEQGGLPVRLQRFTIE
jgi:hypothetical protein